jgi:hypothetical protein
MWDSYREAGETGKRSDFIIFGSQSQSGEEDQVIVWFEKKSPCSRIKVSWIRDGFELAAGGFATSPRLPGR